MGFQSMSVRAHFRNRRTILGRLVMLTSALLIFTVFDAWALEIDSVRVDRVNQKIVVKGSGFDVATGFTLGGVSVATDNVSTTELDIPFSPDLATAVMWRGSYRMVADGSVEFSVYIKAPIDDPTPPPPPPPGGTTCPCTDAWEASGIPKDNITLCYYGMDGTQEFIYGQRSEYFISAAFDPNNIFFDPVDPDNSISYCALHDGVSWTVAEPVVNQDEYNDCENWMWIRVCI